MAKNLKDFDVKIEEKDREKSSNKKTKNSGGGEKRNFSIFFSLKQN